MLVITSKKYEIEEPIKAVDEEEKTLYEFTMQLTREELSRVNEILIDKDLIVKGKEQAKHDILSEEYTKLEQEMIDKALKNQDEFESLCFKEHREPFKQAVGEAYYLDMVEKLFDFFWKAFIDKKVLQVNTMTTDLRKIGNN
jgi:hypothetical protein